MKKKKQTLPLRHKVHQHVKMAVVPHKKNQYRPHLIRRYGLASVLVLIIIAQGMYNFGTQGNILGSQNGVSVSELLDETNAARTKLGETPLVLDEKLSKAAALKAEDMIADQYWAHTSPDGAEPWKWLGDVEYNYAQAGENLAKGFSASDAVVNAWLNSAEHRDNVLKADYADVGFATVNGELMGEQTTLVVAMYGKASDGVVAGSQANFQPAVQSASIIERFGATLGSMSPVLLGSLVLMMVVAMVAFVAHAYRNKLPKPLRQSWYRHHGLYKAVGMTSLIVVVLALYNGGQI